MRGILTWLMVLGVFVGMIGRVVAEHHEVSKHAVMIESHDCGHQEHDRVTDGEDHHHHHHQDEGDHDPEHSGKPHHHHHHDCCSGSLPLAMDLPGMGRLRLPSFSLLRFRPDGEVPPDGPFPALDKPPLI